MFFKLVLTSSMRHPNHPIILSNSLNIIMRYMMAHKNDEIRRMSLPSSSNAESFWWMFLKNIALLYCGKKGYGQKESVIMHRCWRR